MSERENVVISKQTIDTLLLNKCGWDDQSFSALVGLFPTLARCSVLVHLNLAGNKIGDAGMIQLADALVVRVIMSGVECALVPLCVADLCFCFFMIPFPAAALTPEKPRVTAIPRRA